MYKVFTALDIRAANPFGLLRGDVSKFVAQAAAKSQPFAGVVGNGPLPSIFAVVSDVALVLHRISATPQADESGRLVFVRSVGLGSKPPLVNRDSYAKVQRNEGEPSDCANSFAPVVVYKQVGAKKPNNKKYDRHDNAQCGPLCEVINIKLESKHKLTPCVLARLRGDSRPRVAAFKSGRKPLSIDAGGI